jgi:hypothetical protein
VNKKELALLEQAFAAEINSALEKSLPIIQPKATALADKLVADGLLQKVVRKVGSPPMVVTVEGYQLTLAGNLAYCMEQ